MHIITFILVLFASLGALYIGTKAFVFLLQRIGLFLWNKFGVPTIRSVQAVIKKHSSTSEKGNSVVETEFTQTQQIAEQEPELDDLEIPTYLRKGKKLVW